MVLFIYLFIAFISLIHIYLFNHPTMFFFLNLINYLFYLFVH